MLYDLMIVGPATRDLNIDYDGTLVKAVGGPVTFCTPAATSVGANVFVAVKIAPRDEKMLDAIAAAPEHMALMPSRETTVLRNEYFTITRERRNTTCLAQSDPICLNEIPNVDCKLFYLAGLLHGDYPLELIPALSMRGKLCADMQGFLRHNVDGHVEFRDWPEKAVYMKYFDYLKVDAAEAEILTGFHDRRAAAKALYELGAKEILVSFNEEMMVYDGKEYHTCPVRSRSLSGRTGRGDTVTAAYLAMRVKGSGISEALRYATACVSLKMETPGPFCGSREDVLAYMKEFY